MPRPKLNSLDQPPYPTPSTSPTSLRSTPPSLKPNAPPSPTTKPRLGQSILGQLLASHKGRDHYTLANDAALSLETIRPKEQRRSGLPASWAFGFSRTTTPVPSPSTLNTVSPLAINMANRKGRAADPDQHYQTVLPSAWLEKILAGLSKSKTEAPPHYATLPKDGFPGPSTSAAPRSVMSLFDVKGKSSPRPPKDTVKQSSKSKRLSNRATPSTLTKPGVLSPTPVGALLHPGRPEAPHKLVRRSSACELALGEDARGLFQQNRPKTLSSAVISSTIVKKQKGSEPESEKGLTSESATSTSSSSSSSLSSSSSSSSSTSTSSSSSSASGNLEVPTVAESGTPPTTTVTRGRFTIESSSSTPLVSPMARTRTLSTASTSSCSMAPVSSFSSSHLAPPTLTSGGTRPLPDQPTISLSPASPLSFSLPSSPSARSSSARSFSVPSGPPSPSNGSTSSSSSSSNPISIPRAGKSNHQRTHSNSSVQSSGSTSSSSRRSQVIIPPANTAALQFASFSSMASSSSGAGSGNVPLSPKPPAVKRANSSNNNNFRNLSIHVLGKDTDDEEDTEVPSGPESDGSQVFHLETSVHPLDHPTMLSSRANTSPNPQHHQTMHRVHPQSHVHVDPNDSTGSSVTRCGSFCCSSGRSSLNSLSSFGASEMPTSVEYGPACHAGYFRQRSLSATHLTSVYDNNSTGSIPPVPVPASASSYHHHSQHLQPQRHSSSWSDRPGRRTYGSMSHEASHLPHHLLQLHSRNSTPSLHDHNQLVDSPGSTGRGSFGETSDVVMVKKSATGRMFTVERTIPVSPTRCSRFIVVSAEEEAAQAAAALENGGGSRSHTPLSSTPTQ